MSGFRHAFSLSKQEVYDATPPGTATLIDNELVRTETGHHEHNEQHIHLQPTPSSDPADPLNFPKWRKYTILALMAWFGFLANFQSAIISSALGDFVTAWAVFSPFGPPTGLVPFPKLTQLIAVNSLMLGAGNLLWVPLSNTIGRRPVIVFCLLMLTVFSVWAAKADSFNSFLAARIMTGFAAAPADTLAPDVLGHIFFVHERGRSMAIYTVFLTAGSLVSGIIGGYLSHAAGWQWTMWIVVILSAITFLASLLLLPETLYDRKVTLATAHDESEVSSENEKSRTTHVTQVNSHVYQPYTFARSLGLMKPRPGFFRRCFSGFATLRLPGCLMVMLHYAGLVGLIVTCSVIAPQLLMAPPYLFGAGVGLINIGPLIGAILGGLYTYLTADWLVKRAARRERHGFTEPEGRLPLMFPALFIGTTGSLVFGFVAQNPSGLGWVGLGVGFGMIAFGLMQVPSIGFNYLIEAYGEHAADCFTMVVVFRAIISFAWTFFVGDWIARDGATLPFGIFALIMGVFSLTTIPVWLYGKRMRIATAPWVQKERFE